ncbi:MAG: hypothetical protein MUE81_16365 [Thermoflexibacter sp.]|jgi:hypothetical protein|nr:hypothetical protein [Thermoflexibacter sp.]
MEEIKKEFHALRNGVLKILLYGKVLIFFELLLTVLIRRYTIEDVVDLGIILFPLFTAHLTIILRYYFSHDVENFGNIQIPDEKSYLIKLKQKRHIAYFILSTYIILSVIVISLGAFVWGDTLPDLEYNPDAIVMSGLPLVKKVIGFLEGLIGVYIGIIIEYLYKIKAQ